MGQRFLFIFALSKQSAIKKLKAMQQRILTITKKVNAVDMHRSNLDDLTTQLNSQGWSVKQIVSTNLERQSGNGSPLIAITILVEKE